MQSMAISQVVEQLGNEKDNAKRLALLRAVTDLFFIRAGNHSEAENVLFDDVMSKLAREAEEHIRRELSERIGDNEHAPKGLVRQLASDEISVAQPVLAASPVLTDEDLVSIAKEKDQAHMLAISMRKTLSEAVTDVLVERGDQSVARSVAKNSGALFSDQGFNRLVARSDGDEQLQESLSARPDLPKEAMKELLQIATEKVRERLKATATAEDAALIDDALNFATKKVSADIEPEATLDLSDAMRFVGRLKQENTLSEDVLFNLATEKSLPECICALSALTQIDIDNAKNFMTSKSPEALMLVSKAYNFKPATVAALLATNPNIEMNDRKRVDYLYQYQNMAVAMAQRIVRFWRVRATTSS